MTADRSWNGRYFPVMGVGLIAAALVATGCAENRRFAKQGATKETRKLVVPARITPPVTVARIEGTPKAWQLNLRVAKALRARDVPAGTQGRGKASYTLNGRAERMAPAEGSRTPRLRIAWTLLDTQGKRVGSASQIALHPVAADAKLNANIDRKPDPVALDRMARIAAERLTPLVPHTTVKRAQTASAAGASRSGGPIWRRIVGAPVTALGKQDARRGSNGLSARFLRLRNVSTVPVRKSAAEPAAKPRTPVTPAKAAERAPVVKPATAEGPGLTRRSVVTENIAFVASPGRPAVTPIAASGRKSPIRKSPIHKSTAIRPAPGTAKLSATKAGPPRARVVQIAEAAGGRESKPAKAYWVQLASNPSPKASRAAWAALVAAHGELLERQPYAINRANLGSKGVYYRLQLGPYPNIAQAKRVCASLQARRVPCLLMAARGQVAARDRTTHRTIIKPEVAPERPAPKAAPKAEAPKPRKSAPKTAAKRTPTRTPAKPHGKAAEGKAAEGKAAAGEASAIKPAAGRPSAKADPKPRAGNRAGHSGRAAARKPGLGARAETPKTQADKLPFQRSRALPGLPD